MTFQTLSIESNTSFEMSSLLLNSNGNAFFSTYSLVSWTLRSWDYSTSLKIKELKQIIKNKGTWTILSWHMQTTTLVPVKLYCWVASSSIAVMDKFLFTDPTAICHPGFYLQCIIWATLNSFHPGQGHCPANQNWRGHCKYPNYFQMEVLRDTVNEDCFVRLFDDLWQHHSSRLPRLV